MGVLENISVSYSGINNDLHNDSKSQNNRTDLDSDLAFTNQNEK